ncbi:hypothetical protein Pelo_84 [Pelomyxa schiedti]|nr:hypothetical protein Pelo_84 [Pelomyxa schiedti]
MSLGGKLDVTIVSCSHLAAADANGLSDPYVVLVTSEGKWRTETILQNLDPVFNKTLTVQVADAATDAVVVEVWDWDEDGGDDFLGYAGFMVNKLRQGEEISTELQLRVGPKSEGHSHRGRVSIKYKALDFSGPWANGSPTSATSTTTPATNTTSPTTTPPSPSPSTPPQPGVTPPYPGYPYQPYPGMPPPGTPPGVATPPGTIPYSPYPYFPPGGPQGAPPGAPPYPYPPYFPPGPGPQPGSPGASPYPYPPYYPPNPAVTGPATAVTPTPRVLPEKRPEWVPYTGNLPRNYLLNAKKELYIDPKSYQHDEKHHKQHHHHKSSTPKTSKS